jgi:uncharacterized protein YbgA (DUF1722 family)
MTLTKEHLDRLIDVEKTRLLQYKDTITTYKVEEKRLLARAAEVAESVNRSEDGYAMTEALIELYRRELNMLAAQEYNSRLDTSIASDARVTHGGEFD